MNGTDILLQPREKPSASELAQRARLFDKLLRLLKRQVAVGQAIVESLRIALRASLMKNLNLPFSSFKNEVEIISEYDLQAPMLKMYRDCNLVSPAFFEEEFFYSERDQLRLHVLIKGKKLGFSLQELRFIIESHNGSTTSAWPDLSSNPID